jgi:fatty acid desaturase
VARLVLRGPGPARGLLLPLFLLQGLWLDRLYTVGHEAVHRKLFPRSPRWNDLWGTLMLAPLLAPLSIFRRIHAFHHGQNRRDPATAALDSFVADRPLSPARRWYYRGSWIFLVFLGGFFVHTVVSILLFLGMPTAVAQRISPVFAGWSGRQRLRAWLELLPGVALHGGVALQWGTGVWLLVLGLPLLGFAWLWSMLLYIYHYDTSLGDGVRYNVRSLPPQRILSWVLLHFNEHATHHADPRLPWYKLPDHRKTLPAEYQSNDNVTTLRAAVLQQLRGPLLWERLPTPSSPASESAVPEPTAASRTARFRRLEQP